MWVLILTLAMRGQAVTVTTQDGFASQESCMIAAKAWTEQVERMPLSNLHRRALCVRK
jgi:hypothetical protein